MKFSGTEFGIGARYDSLMIVYCYILTNSRDIRVLYSNYLQYLPRKNNKVTEGKGYKLVRAMRLSRRNVIAIVYTIKLRSTSTLHFAPS